MAKKLQIASVSLNSTVAKVDKRPNSFKLEAYILPFLFPNKLCVLKTIPCSLGTYTISIKFHELFYKHFRNLL